MASVVIGNSCLTPLTKTKIDKQKVPQGDRQIYLWDTTVTGFGVRRLPGGSKTFVYRYRPRGAGRSANPSYLKLGSWPSLSLEDARTAARMHVGNVPPMAKTRLLSCVKSGGAPTPRWASSAHSRNVRENRRKSAAVPGLPSVISSSMAVTMSLRVRAAMSIAMCAFRPRRNELIAVWMLTNPFPRRCSSYGPPSAVARGYAPRNEMAGLHKVVKTRAQRLQDGEEKGKSLSDGEIVKVWRAAQAIQERAARGERIARSFGGLVQLALLTGMRRGELPSLSVTATS
jgi:hypothetical protein